MTRAITFMPGARPGDDNPDLHYFEHASRNRSVHSLFQDVAPGHSASRTHFLHKAYGELVSRYGSVGRIEHPLPFLRSLTQTLDSLSRRADCRVDDFAGIGVFVLLRDAGSFYLLASRGGRVMLNAGDGFKDIAGPGLPWVRELPLETAAAQKELFTDSVRDYLILYRIDAPAPEVPGNEISVRVGVVMGGRPGDVDTVVESIGRPGEVRTGDESGESVATAHDGVSNKVVYAVFPPAQPVRDPLLDALRAGERSPRPHLRRVVTAAATTLVFAIVASLWIAPRLGGGEPDGVASMSDPIEASVETQASQHASTRLEEVPAQEPAQEMEMTPEPDTDTPAVDDAAGAEETEQISMAVAWSRKFSEAVTTTPVVDGDAVIFGARDGHVYSLDCDSGEPTWSYGASDGVGASPVVAGNVVIGADYRGRVFCLHKSSGKEVWTRALPAKVVSTPCVAGGEVLVGCTDGNAYGLSLETGRILWQVKTGGRIRGSATTAEGSFYLTSYDGNVYAIAQGSGGWKHQIGGQLTSTPAADGERVVAGADGGIFAMDVKSGRRLWRFRTRQPVRSFITMAGGRVYAGCNDGNVYCLDADSGEELWKAATGDVVLSRPRFEEGLLFVTSYDKKVYCFDADSGERMAEYGTSGSIYSSPVIHEDRLFFGNNEGAFYCISYRSDGL